MGRKWIMIVFLSLFLFGCTTDDCQVEKSETSSFFSKISKEDALNIANDVLDKTTTTRHVPIDEMFSYVLSDNNKKTRSISIPDTLAYVINYPNNDGFVIVATDRRVNPVLGFSDKGNFSFENDNAKVDFIDRIETYMANANSDVSYDSDNYNMYYQVLPVLKISLSQGSPWNKYVIKDHPGCPAGCVAVATALVLSHSLLELDYHGSKYYFKSIIEAINKGQNIQNMGPLYYDTDWNKVVQPEYSYEQAVDSMSKFLYWIGKDVNMSYTTSASSASSYSAYSLCKNIKDVDNLEYIPFNINAITWLLKNGNIVYLRGTDINGNGGHAWVADGACYCVTSTEDKRSLIREEITETYIHCDWGWGGISNGYYSGSVFSAGGYNFQPLNYFALKRGENSIINVIR